MNYCFRQRLVPALLLALALLWCASGARAQETDEFGDTAADPVKLFDRAQEAHAKKEFERALELYEEALQLRPDFPEAEFQKAAALVALKRLPEAEKAYRRAMELRKTWALPPAALGSMLMRTPGREREAETLLRRALELDAKNLSATIELAALRTRAGDNAESVTLLRRAVALRDDAALWVALARAESAAKDSASAVKSYSRAIELGEANVEARLGRADLLIRSGEKERALEDLRALEAQTKSDWKLAVLIANLYGLAGRNDEARRVYDSLSEEAKRSEEGRKLFAALTDAPCEETPEARAALERLVAAD